MPRKQIHKNRSASQAGSRAAAQAQARAGAQTAFKGVSGWGGKRAGAGRPNLSGQVNHMKRARVKSATPLHLTWRLKDDVVNLRSYDALKLFKAAAVRARGFGLRILHFSLQSNHIHLIVECKSNEALKLGTRSLGTSLGKGIRKLAGGVGSVFAGRFHLQVLVNPTRVRNAMAYVLQNYSKHARLLNHIDRYSSAPYFYQWRQLLGARMGPILAGHSGPPARPIPDFLSPPQSWLGREGWLRAKGARQACARGVVAGPCFEPIESSGGKHVKKPNGCGPWASKMRPVDFAVV